MRGRGQLVVLAGAVVAVALIPVLVAALQLGGGAVSGATEAGIGSVDRVLESAVADAAPTTLAYPWRDRETATTELQDVLASTLSQIEAGVGARVVTVTYDGAKARTLATTACPAGENRQFGSCAAVDGVVVQDRDGTTHVVAVAFRVTVVSADGRTAVTLVVRPPVRVRG